MSRQRVLVVAPHPDDEVLGVGGTIAKLASEGAVVQVAIVTKGMPPLFNEELISRGRAEATRAHALLGIDKTHFLDLPAAELDRVPHRVVNEAIARVVRAFAPDIVFVPFGGDVHLDHQMVYASCLVAVRPNGGHCPRAVYAYETLSETNWSAPYLGPNFIPNHFIDISGHLERKVAALSLYESQLKQFPNERSVEAVRALAALRGATVGIAAAEGFVVIRTLS